MPSDRLSTKGGKRLTYGLPVLLVALATLLRLALERWSGPLPLYITFYPAMILSALAGGALSGLLATALSALVVSLIYLPPIGSPGISLPGDMVTLAIFCLSGALVSLMAGWLRVARTETEIARRSEERFRSMFEHHRAIMLLIEPETGAIVDANAAACEYYGYSRDKLLTLSIREINQVSAEEGAAERQGAEAQERNHCFSPHRLADGTVRWVEVYSTPVKVQMRELLFAVIHDITERRKAEESLKRSEATLRSLIDATRETVMLIDTKGAVLMANETVAERLGTSVGDLVGTCAYDHFSPELAQLRRERFERVIRTGEPVCFQDERAHSAYESYAYPVFDKEGTVTAVAIFARDITERKNLEAQLRQAQKMEAIGTLAGGVAHDFNNLLTVIMGFSCLIQAQINSDDRLRPYIDQVITSSEKAADLTQRLLAFSRKQRITLEPHSINDIVRSTAKLLKRLLPEDIELKIDLTGADPIAHADVSQMDQVLMNLATNARDAMPRGGSLIIKTEVSTLGEEFHEAHGFGIPGRYVSLSVSDSGMGMDKETMERIFDPFFTTKEVGKGTGLGLASVYGTVKQHRGYITVSSELHQGTSFHIYLPLVDAPHRQETAPAEKIGKGTETVLVAEDDPDVRNMLAKMLENQGYVVVGAVDGEDAVRVYKEHKDSIDMVILDVVMPGKNGKEALDEIASINRRVKALFVSGYTGDVVIDKGIRRESVDFVRKPVSVPELLSKMREMLDR